MTLVKITNSNTTTGTPYYIELWASKVEDNTDHEVINFPLPLSPADWIVGGVITQPERIIFDLKQTTEAYQINSQITVDSNRDVNWNPNPTADVWDVAENLKDIANSGGVVQLTFDRETSSQIIEGVITNLKFSEDAEDQGPHGMLPTRSPKVLLVQIAFLIGQNAEN